MKVSLYCTNQKSQIELDALDETYPEDDEGRYYKTGYDTLQFRKYDYQSKKWIRDWII
jgi:hypothetical protein